MRPAIPRGTRWRRGRGGWSARRGSSASHSRASSAASATRFFCPPDSWSVDASSTSPMPRRDEHRFALPLLRPKAVADGGTHRARGQYRQLRERADASVAAAAHDPRLGSRSPLIIVSSVLLPEPLRPTTPMRSPSLRVSERSVNSGRFGRDALEPCASIRITSQATGRRRINRPRSSARRRRLRACAEYRSARGAATGRSGPRTTPARARNRARRRRAARARARTTTSARSTSSAPFIRIRTRLSHWETTFGCTLPGRCVATNRWSPYLRPSPAMSTPRSAAAARIGSSVSAGKTLCASSTASSTGSRSRAPRPPPSEQRERDDRTFLRARQAAEVEHDAPTRYDRRSRRSTFRRRAARATSRRCPGSRCASRASPFPECVRRRAASS